MVFRCSAFSNTRLCRPSWSPEMTAARCREADDESLRRDVDRRSDLPVLLLSRLGMGGAILAAQCLR
jgi:hypothetical protein